MEVPCSIEGRVGKKACVSSRATTARSWRLLQRRARRRKSRSTDMTKATSPSSALGSWSCCSRHRHSFERRAGVCPRISRRELLPKRRNSECTAETLPTIAAIFRRGRATRAEARAPAHEHAILHRRRVPRIVERERQPKSQRICIRARHGIGSARHRDQ